MEVGLYIEINLICILAQLVFLVRLLLNKATRNRHLLLIINLGINILLFSADASWALIEAGILPSSRAINYLVNILYFVFTAISGYVWILYCSAIQGTRVFKHRVAFLLMTFPGLFLIVTTILSPILKWVFYIDETNSYQRGSMYFIQVAVTYGYILSASIISWVNAAKKENIAYRPIYFSCGNLAIFSMIGVALQLYLPGYPVTAVGLTLPLLIVMLKISDSNVLVDNLTLLHNRNWFYETHPDYRAVRLSPDTAHNYPRFRYILLFDIDGLAGINKTHGNDTGNLVVKQVAHIFKKLAKLDPLGVKMIPVRFGGDEFLLLCESDNPNSYEQLIYRINQEIKKLQKINGFRVTISCGHAEYKLSEDPYVQDVIMLADEDMYKMKKLHR